MAIERSAFDVTGKSKRRTFTAEYKKRILQQAEVCKETGRLGALLRNEGLYASHIANWRTQAVSTMLGALAPKRRGPPKDLVAGHVRALAEKDRAIAQWKRRALRAEALVKVQRTRLSDARDGIAMSAKLDLKSSVHAAATELGVSSTCAALGVSRSTYYRELAPKQGPKQRRRSLRRLSDAERQVVLNALNEDRFIGLSPAAIHAKMLGEGRYLCSVRTIHRILAEQATANKD